MSKSAIVTSRLKVAAAKEMVLGGMHSPDKKEGEKLELLKMIAGRTRVNEMHYNSIIPNRKCTAH